MSYKSSTNEKLLQLYKDTSKDNVIQVGRAMLESSTHKEDKHFLAHTHGEICETVLECIILDYLKKYNLTKYGWFYEKGLILKDVNNAESGYFTELDLTVFTPQKIFAFECKSYGGDKKITDVCTIRKKSGSSFDVYEQHKKHFMVLADQLKPFRIINSENSLENPYQLILFNFSTGTTIDNRDTANKLLMPCLDESNVENIFKLAWDKPVMWDVNRVHKAMQIIEKHSEANRVKHLNYVKNLKH
jgi:hypothetical protein